MLLRVIVLLAALALAQSSESLKFKPHSGATVPSPKTIICPDKTGTCPDGSTCCLLATGRYGCCPYDRGICCSDGLHCCPFGYKCDTAQSRCLQGNNVNNWFSLSQARPLSSNPPTSSSSSATAKNTPKTSSAVAPPAGKSLRPSHKKKNMCPGGKSSCDNGRTCCYMENGHFGCCSFVNGTCCSDRKHCCPLGFTCDMKLGKCTKGGGLSLPWGATEEPKSPNEDSEAKGPSIFRTLLSLLLDTFIDYDQDDDDDEDDDENEKAKRARTMATASVEASKVKVTVSKDQKPPTLKSSAPTAAKKLTKNTEGKQGPGKGVVTNLGQGQSKVSSGQRVKSQSASTSSKPSTQVPKSSATPSKPAQNPPSADLKGKIVKQQLKQAPGGANQKLKSTKVPVPPSKSKIDGSTASTTKPSNPTPTAKSATKVPVSQKVNQQASKTSPKSPVKQPDLKQSLPKKSEPPAKSPILTASKTQSDVKSAPPSKNLQASNVPKVQEKLQTKRMIEPKTSTRLDDGKRQKPPPIPPRTKFKPGVKSVLKTIPKPPQVVKKTTVKPKTSVKAKVAKSTVKQAKSHTSNLQPKKSHNLAQNAKTAAPSDLKKPVIANTAQNPALKTVKSQVNIVRKTTRVTTQKNDVDSQSELSHSSSKAGKSDVVTKKVGVHIKVETTVPLSKLSDIKAKQAKEASKPKPKANTAQRAPTIKVVGDPALAKSLFLRSKARKSANSVKKNSDSYRTLQEPVEGGVNYVICPDRVSQCPDGSTCCSLLSGEWGCCPMPKAVCCSDRLHCCPSGSQCDVSAGTCIHPSTSWETTVDPISVPFALLSEYNGHASAEWCDEDSFCPIGTHCVNIQDELRCSPFPKPVTCFDNLHVCPEGSQCDQSSGLCHYPSAPWEEKRPAVRDPVTSDPVTSDLVTCDDNTTSCDFGTTCCLMLDGHYSCCPFPFAVCCSDKLHCCPDHTECDIQKGECRDRDSSRSLWGQKSRSGPLFQIANNIIPSPDQSDKALSSVICPDQSSTCPDSTTCCKLITGQYGCCPLPEATCCSDGSHCCPQGYKCDPSHGACLKIVDTELIPQASDGSLEVSPVSSIVCPDKTSQCQSGSTCCLLPDKTYGCCPIPNAVCCADHLHCCPAGTTCDTKTMTCSHQESSLTISWSDVGRSLALVAPVQTDNNVGKTVICKDKTQCPQGSTCCLMTSGAYGCCPYNNGSCCSDKIHCCPNGFECSSTGTSCQKKGSSLVLSSEQFTRNQAVVKDSVLADKPTLSDSVADVPCPGGKASCASGQTCCQLKSGDYGCCPFPQATCCADGQHCCPQGFACDPQSGTCTQSIPWLNKIPALRRQPAARALP